MGMGKVGSPDPRFERKPVNSGGIRRLGLTGPLLVQILEWGTYHTVPLDPPDGLQVLDVRYDQRSDIIEALVRSPSFKGGEDATWETAEWWNPPFRRIGDSPL